MPILYGLNFMVDAGLKKSRHRLYSEWNDIYSGKTDASLLIMGSSRAWVHYSPVVLDDILKTKSYNIGMNGWGFSMQYARLKILLRHNPKPKYIIQNLETSLLQRRENLYEYQQFLPYLNDPIIRSASKGYKGEFSLTQYYLPLFKYNGNWDLAGIGLLNYFGFQTNQTSKYKGYEGQELEWDGSYDKFKLAYPNGLIEKIDADAERDFEEYLNYCKENGIKVFLVYSPEYFEVQDFTINRKDVMAMFQSYAKKYDIPLLDYSNHPICFDKSYFYNSQHLNKKGSELFSKILAQDLLNLGIN